MTTNEKIAALRDLMKERGIDMYLIPTDDFHSSEYESNISQVEFINTMNLPNNVIASWDLSDKKNNSIIGFARII